MKTALRSLWRFIRDIHASTDGASSKRFYGGIIVMSCLVLLYLFSSGFAHWFTIPIWDKVHDTMENFFLIGASLIGLDTVRQIWSIGAGKRNKDNKDVNQ